MWGSYEGAYICQKANNQIWGNYIMLFEKSLIKIQNNYAANCTDYVKVILKQR